MRDRGVASVVPGPEGERGPPGRDGKTGPSAYDVAREAGYVGTRSQWLDALRGPRGPRGDIGPAGESGQRGERGMDGKAAAPPESPQSAHFERDEDTHETLRVLVRFPSSTVAIVPAARDADGYLTDVVFARL